MTTPTEGSEGWGLCFGPAWQTSVADLVELARDAEDAGFERITTGEFRSDALTWLAILAGATRSIPVATTIASIALRHPSVVGEAMAALGDVHGDRIELGLGVSHPSLVTEDLGLPQPSLADLESYVTAVRSVLRGEAWEDGRYQVPAHDRHRLLASHGPVLVSVLGEIAARRAAHYADGVILTWSPVNWTRRLSQQIREVDAAMARTTRIWVVLPTFPTPDVATAMEACARHLRPYLHLPSYRRMLELSMGDRERIAWAASPDVDDREAADILGREAIESVVALGDREGVLATIQSTREAGADGIILYPLDTGSGWREAVKSTITGYAPR